MPLLSLVRNEKGLGADAIPFGAWVMEKLGTMPVVDGLSTIGFETPGVRLKPLLYILVVFGDKPPVLSMPRVKAAECSGFSSSGGVNFGLVGLGKR